MNFKVLSFLWFYAFHSSYRGKVQVCFVADGRRIPELAHQSVHQSFLVFYIFTQYSPVLENAESQDSYSWSPNADDA